MYLVSDQFTEAIRNGATIRTRADLFCGGVKCAELPVVSGTVTVDSTATVRRHCSLELSVEENMELIPAKQHEIASPGLWPTGSEIKLSRRRVRRRYERDDSPWRVQGQPSCRGR
jgi:hypothetical protein